MNQDSLYYNLPISESSGKLISTVNGEVLYVYYSGIINMKKLQERLKKSTIKPCFRLFLLNSDETINYEIPQEDIKLDNGSFTENYQSGQRKNVNIDLINNNGQYNPSINTIWVHNRFRFDVGIQDGNTTYWFPRGIYVLNNPIATHEISLKEISLSLVDKFAILEGPMGTLEATYEIPVGSDIKQAIEGILTLDNGAGFPIDLKPIVYDHSFEGLKMPYTLKKDAGSTLGEMILDIGTILNAEVFYNSLGNLCFININETIDDSSKQTLWYYTENEREYNSSSLTYDFENVINEVQVVGDYVNNNLSYAYIQNTNPESPICIQRIGRRIKYVEDTNIYNNHLASDRAKYELRKNTLLNTSISVTVSFNPLLFVNNLIGLEDSFFEYQRQKFLIQTLSYNISTEGTMNISCTNVQNFALMENNYDNNFVSIGDLPIGYDLSGVKLYFSFPNNFDINYVSERISATNGFFSMSKINSKVIVYVYDNETQNYVYNSSTSTSQLIDTYTCSSTFGTITEKPEDVSDFIYIKIKE